MTNWDKYGVAALINKNADKIKDVLRVMESIGLSDKGIINEECYREITSIRQTTGLTIGFVSDTIYLMDGTTILLEYKTRKTEISHQVSSIQTSEYLKALKSHIENAEVGNGMLITSDNEKTPVSGLQMKRTLFEIAAAIDRHDAFKRYSLPNLRSSSNHVLMVDPFAICIATPAMIRAPLEERIKSFKERLIKMNFLKRKYIHDDIRIVGNLVIAETPDASIANGVFRIKAEITESQRHAIIGLPLENLVEGHILSTSKAIIRSIAFGQSNEDERILIIDTNAIDTDGFIPVKVE